jgi:hypothetical protein
MFFINFHSNQKKTVVCLLKQSIVDENNGKTNMKTGKEKNSTN